MSQPCKEPKHVRLGPGLEVGRCGARPDGGKLLKWAPTPRRSTCPGCQETLGDGFARLQQSIRDKAAYVKGRPFKVTA